jgi:hypothetical protein
MFTLEEGPGNDGTQLLAPDSVIGETSKSPSESQSVAAPIAGFISEDPSIMTNVIDKDSLIMAGVEDSSKVKAAVLVSFGALDKSGNDVEEAEVEKTGQKDSIPCDQNDLNTESGISEFSETETDEDDENLPLYPSDTDESDADRRAYAEKHTKNPELRAGKYRRPLL